MSTVSIVLTSLLTITLVVLIAPSVIAMNRGRVLQNIAFWLAIVLALALFYQTFGPFKTSINAPNAAQESVDDDQAGAISIDASPSDERGYMPPKE